MSGDNDCHSNEFKINIMNQYQNVTCILFDFTLKQLCRFMTSYIPGTNFSTLIENNFDYIHACLSRQKSNIIIKQKKDL